jgi:hypothetical protein
MVQTTRTAHQHDGRRPAAGDTSTALQEPQTVASTKTRLVSSAGQRRHDTSPPDQRCADVEVSLTVLSATMGKCCWLSTLGIVVL